MGCGGSAFAYGPAPPNLVKANGGFESGLGEVNDRRTGYKLDTRTLNADHSSWNAYFCRESAASGHLHQGPYRRVVYKVLPHREPPVKSGNFNCPGDGPANAVSRSMMHIVKGSDQSKLAVLQLGCSLTGMPTTAMKYQSMVTDGTFKLYSYAPNFDGQTSLTKDRDGEPLYLHAMLDDPQNGAMPEPAMNERVPHYHLKLFKTSSSVEDAVPVLRYKAVAKAPYRVIVKGMAVPVTPGDSDTHDPEVLATIASDYYLMSQSGDEPNDRYFTWDKQNQWGVDCAAGVDSLLVICVAMSVGPNAWPWTGVL